MTLKSSSVCEAMMMGLRALSEAAATLALE
jgi:hypothetical protein